MTTPPKTDTSRLYLSSPTMHGDDEFGFVREAFETNWLSTVGENIDRLEEGLCAHVGCKYAVGLASGTSALHLAVKLAGEQLYGKTVTGMGALNGKKVFCSDLTFDATVNPIVYECGKPVFIDTERDTWNMSPEALLEAFKKFPEVKLIVVAHLYGTPAKWDEIRKIANMHGALIVEDAAESLGATYRGRQTGSLGDFNCISFNGNKIITGSCGGAFLTYSKEDAEKVRKWSTQSREQAPWYQHVDLGYNYRMSNIVAGVVRGQLPHLNEHVALKKAIYERYRNAFCDLPLSMNPFEDSVSEPNFWLSCILIDSDAMCRQERTDLAATYTPESGKTCPTEIMEALFAINAESRPVWKPMHMQPIFEGNEFVAAHPGEDVGADLFDRGLCLPSDIKMTEKQQESVIKVLRGCFE